MHEIFSEIESRFLVTIKIEIEPKPEYRVITEKVLEQSSSIINRGGFKVCTFYTQNHIELANHYCHLLNSKK